MKVLIVSQNLFSKRAVNTPLIDEYFKEIKKNISKDFEFSYFGVRDENINPTNNYFVTNKTLIDLFEMMSSNKSRIIKIIKILKTPKYYTFLLKYKLDLNAYASDIYYYELTNNIELAEFDKIILISAPLFVNYLVEKISKIKPVYLFKLDPFSTHYTIQKKHREKLIDFENKINNLSEGVFVTNELYEDYKTTSILCENIDKIHPISFVIPFDEKPRKIQSKESVVTLIFGGTIYKDIRNLDFFFKILNKVNTVKIKLSLAAKFSGYTIKEEKNIISNDYVDFLGLLKHEQFELIIEESDFIVNVGNTIKNQVPSKIFEYIATGKPIIHIAKNKDCSTLKYLNRYPNALIIFEDEDINHQVSMFEDFILKSKNHRISSKTIKLLYPENSLLTNSKKIYSVLKGEDNELK